VPIYYWDLMFWESNKRLLDWRVTPKLTGYIASQTHPFKHQIHNYLLMVTNQKVIVRDICFESVSCMAVCSVLSFFSLLVYIYKLVWPLLFFLFRFPLFSHQEHPSAPITSKKFGTIAWKGVSTDTIRRSTLEDVSWSTLIHLFLVLQVFL
jgi:hypothetical protein